MNSKVGNQRGSEGAREQAQTHSAQELKVTDRTPHSQRRSPRGEPSYIVPLFLSTFIWTMRQRKSCPPSQLINTFFVNFAAYCNGFSCSLSVNTFTICRPSHHRLLLFDFALSAQPPERSPYVNITYLLIHHAVARGAHLTH